MFLLPKASWQAFLNDVNLGPVASLKMSCKSSSISTHKKNAKRHLKCNKLTKGKKYTPNYEI